MTAAHVIMGKFASPYGVRGWIKVISFSHPFTNLVDYRPWLREQAGAWEPLLLQAVKPHGNFLIAKITGIDTPEQARLLTHQSIAVPATELPTLPANQQYWHDLLGLRVINREGIELGKITDILATGANDVLVVHGERERLLPYIDSVVQAVDIKQGYMTVDWHPDD